MSFTTEPTTQNGEGIRDKGHLFITSILQRALDVKGKGEKSENVKYSLKEKRDNGQVLNMELDNSPQPTPETLLDSITANNSIFEKNGNVKIKKQNNFGNSNKGYKKGTMQLIDGKAPNATANTGSATVPTNSIAERNLNGSRAKAKKVSET